MKKYFIPDLKKILFEKKMWKPGWLPDENGDKPRMLSQSSIPADDKILEKLGISRGDKILSIASNHGDWAREIKNHGCIVDYNEYSRFFIDYVKKRILFNKFILANFAEIPKKEKEYDWTFSYEAVGGKKALPIAMLRSLLNRKGGILVFNASNKKESYYNIVRVLAKAYEAEYEIKNEKFDGFIHNKYRAKNGFGLYKKEEVPCVVFILYTNNAARVRASRDLKFLEKKVDLKAKDSLERFGKLNVLFNKEYLKEIK